MDTLVAVALVSIQCTVVTVLVQYNHVERRSEGRVERHDFTGSYRYRYMYCRANAKGLHGTLHARIPINYTHDCAVHIITSYAYLRALRGTSGTAIAIYCIYV